MRLGPFRIVVIYTLLSVLWILFSDALLDTLVEEQSMLTTLQTYKGIFFVLATAALLYTLIRSHVNSLKSVQAELEESKERLEYVIRGSDLGYWDWEYQTGKQKVNDKWMDILGLEAADLEGTIEDWKRLLHPEDALVTQTTVTQALKYMAPFVMEFRMRHKQGHWVWIEGSGAVVQRDKEGNPLRLAGTHKDITARKKADEELAFLAHYDPLTRLPNRILLKKRLKEWPCEKSAGLCFLDLDHFKMINDLYGHLFGDKVIQAVAERLQKYCPEKGFLARVGADEFAFVFEEVASAKAKSEGALSALRAPFVIEGKTIYIKASAGIATYPDDASNNEELLKNVDTALHEAKRMGKNQVVHYAKAMTDQIVHYDSLDKQIQEAIKGDQFVLYYQPQVTLADKKVVGVEVLARWEHPQKGLLPPSAFIPRAEESGAMVQLGWKIVEKALDQMAHWQATGAFEGSLAINISTVQIEEEGFVARMRQLCQLKKVDPARIELEVTESFIMKNAFQSAQKLLALKEAGFKLSVDDFGTGYSSLNYLKQLPIDKLKIDRSFVKDTPQNKDDCAIAKAIITLAKNLRLEVLGEGVETEAQAQFLQEEGCDTAQGYLYARPVSLADFAKMYLQKGLTH
jgi:diguanylate cyclase (GGDEF)-like protein/PAS domain S-box-containing protein